MRIEYIVVVMLCKQIGEVVCDNIENVMYNSIELPHTIVKKAGRTKHKYFTFESL